MGEAIVKQVCKSTSVVFVLGHRVGCQGCSDIKLKKVSLQPDNQKVQNTDPEHSCQCDRAIHKKRAQPTIATNCIRKGKVDDDGVRNGDGEHVHLRNCKCPEELVAVLHHLYNLPANPIQAWDVSQFTLIITPAQRLYTPGSAILAYIAKALGEGRLVNL